RDYLRVLNSLAPAYGHRGDWKSEEVTAKKCVDLAEQILKADPNGASAKYDLMMSTGTLADTFSGEGNYAQAATLRERTLELGRQYAALNPGSKEGQRAVAVALKKLAALYGVLKRYGESHRAYEEARAIDEERLNQNPLDRRASMDLSYDYSDLGWVLSR